MTVAICLPLPGGGNGQNQWDYILSNFSVDVIYVIGDSEQAPGSNVFAKAIYISTADDLPASTLVVVTARNARYVQGDEDLASFSHPSDLIYMFGPDRENLSEVELGRRVPDHKVYIETDTHDDMYSWQAYAVVMWDRRMKSG